MPLARIADQIDKLGFRSNNNWKLRPDKYQRADELVGEFLKRQEFLQTQTKNQGL
jgi:hypothetical protein